MSAFSNSLIDRLYDLRKALHLISFTAPGPEPAAIAMRALAADDKTRERAALDLSDHAASVAARVTELKSLD